MIEISNIYLFIKYIFAPLKLIFLILFIIFGCYIIKNIDTDNYYIIIIIFFKILLYILSYNIEISDEDYNKYVNYLYSNEKYICVFNHISLLDGFLLFATFPKMGVVLYKHKFYEYLNYDDDVNNKSNSIFVSLTEKTNVSQKIKLHIENRKPGGHILFISPSECNLPDNPGDISHFTRKGAFISKNKILPILLKYENNSLIYSHEHETILGSIFKLFLAQNNYTIKIKIGDLINSNEKETICDYKDRVYNIMNEQYKEM
tara:strand:- start:3571 stop:4350 length:780 start_codon:yes stop_codon:yes gene_type:complete